VALFENGAEGPLAAPIARDVLKAYFDKKSRLAAERARERAGEAVTKIGELMRFVLPGPTESARALSATSTRYEQTW